MRRARHFLVAVIVVLSSFVARHAQAQQPPIDREQFARDLTALTSHPSRVIGTRGYDEAAAYIERELTALGSAIEWRRHEYPVMAPVTTSATLHLRTPGVLAPSGSADEPVYPFWPAGVRLCSTPAEARSVSRVTGGWTEGAVTYASRPTPRSPSPTASRPRPATSGRAPSRSPGAARRC